MSKPEKTYANLKSPLISAAVSGLYSFLSAEDGVKVIQQIRDKFIISKVLAENGNNNPDNIVIWVTGYLLTTEEKTAGYLGNYVLIRVDKAKGKKFTLKSQKLESDLKFHPQRKYQKQQHPNWGFPILRRIKKKTEYKTITEAARELQRLQEEFPLVTIPANNKLFAMIYEKDGKKGMVKKYVLEIKTTDTGVFYIDHYENPEAKKAKKEAPRPAAKPIPPRDAGRTQKDEALGEFTAKVILRRAQKRKPRGN